MCIEIEGKYRVVDHDEIRSELQALGAVPGPVQRQADLLFDTAAGDLEQRDMLLRLRSDHEARITFKGPKDAGSQFKAREEIELVVGDLAAMQLILERLGFKVRLGYEKQRQEWRLVGAVVSLDTLDCGNFVEIEGTDEIVQQLSNQLGFPPDSSIKESHGDLMTRWLDNKHGR